MFNGKVCGLLAEYFVKFDMSLIGHFKFLAYPFITFWLECVATTPFNVVATHSNQKVIKGYVDTTIWGETPQTPLSVFDVGFAHDGGIPPTPPQIGGGPPNPPNCIVV